MTWIAMALLLLAAALAQSLFPPVAWLGHVKWPWLLSVTLYYAMRRERKTLLVAAMAGGLLQDALCHSPLGFSPLLFLAVGWPASACKSLVMTETAPTAAAFGSILTGVFVLVGGLWLHVTGAASVSAAGWLGKALGSALLGAVCTPSICSAAGSLDMLLGNIKRKDDIHGAY